MSLLKSPKETKNAPARSYQGLTESLRRRVAEGEWSFGGLLPSRASLAREYGVSLTTVQQAISHLIGEGTLYADGGRGTFVAPAGRPTAVDTFVPLLGGRPLIACPVLGLVDGTSRQNHTLRADAYGWIDVIASHLEAAFQNVGGLIRYFDPCMSIDEVPHETAVEALLREGVDALAIIGVFDEADMAPSLATLLKKQQIPIVFISWHEILFPFAHVFYDSRMAGYEAAEHLRRRGYGPLAYFGYEGKSWSEQRLAGARDAAGNEVRRVITLRETDWSDRAGQMALLDRQIGQLLETPLDNLAARWGVIADNDLLALDLESLAAARGFTAGRDFGLVGFDNYPGSRARGLTTLRPPLESLGEQAAQMLLNQFRGDVSSVQTRLRSQLLPRASTSRF